MKYFIFSWLVPVSSIGCDSNLPTSKINWCLDMMIKYNYHEAGSKSIIPISY